MENLQPISGLPAVIAMVAKVLFVFTMVMLTVAYSTLAERKVSAWIQDRSGPNRVGPWGLLQPIADGLKNFLKEENAPGALSMISSMLAAGRTTRVAPPGSQLMV